MLKTKASTSNDTNRSCSNVSSTSFSQLFPMDILESISISSLNLPSNYLATFTFTFTTGFVHFRQILYSWKYEVGHPQFGWVLNNLAELPQGLFHPLIQLAMDVFSMQIFLRSEALLCRVVICYSHYQYYIPFVRFYIKRWLPLRLLDDFYLLLRLPSFLEAPALQ